MRKFKRLLIVLTASIFLTSCNLINGNSGDFDPTGNVVTDVDEDPTQFTDEDSEDVLAEEADADILLNGSSGTISDTTCGTNGSTVTITKIGKYHVTGSSSNVAIKVEEASESGDIYLILDNVTMTNSLFACLYVSKADKVIIQNIGTSSIVSTYTEGQIDDSSTIDGAIHARDDLTINGTGSLSVNSKLHGVVCKNDLKILGSLELNVTSTKIGFQAGDSLRIGETPIIT
ncbi:MAG TPA: carbohydrate-binding domain-containing protein, partial [Bacilli bacterium]|nr:carbohydrate-binding domain-containing protein [Bacilli bacterium]